DDEHANWKRQVVWKTRCGFASEGILRREKSDLPRIVQEDERSPKPRFTTKRVFAAGVMNHELTAKEARLLCLREDAARVLEDERAGHRPFPIHAVRRVACGQRTLLPPVAH